MKHLPPVILASTHHWTMTQRIQAASKQEVPPKKQHSTVHRCGTCHHPGPFKVRPPEMVQPPPMLTALHRQSLCQLQWPKAPSGEKRTQGLRPWLRLLCLHLPPSRLKQSHHQKHHPLCSISHLQHTRQHSVQHPHLADAFPQHQSVLQLDFSVRHLLQ